MLKNCQILRNINFIGFNPPINTGCPQTDLAILIQKTKPLRLSVLNTIKFIYKFILIFVHNRLSIYCVDKIYMLSCRKVNEVYKAKIRSYGIVVLCKNSLLDIAG